MDIAKILFFSAVLAIYTIGTVSIGKICINKRILKNVHLHQKNFGKCQFPLNTFLWLTRMQCRILYHCYGVAIEMVTLQSFEYKFFIQFYAPFKIISAHMRRANQ